MAVHSQPQRQPHRSTPVAPASAPEAREEPAAATIGSSEGSSSFVALSDDAESARARAFIKAQRKEISQRAARLAGSEA
jgi:hypothetical protein